MLFSDSPPSFGERVAHLRLVTLHNEDEDEKIFAPSKFICTRLHCVDLCQGGIGKLIMGEKAVAPPL